MVEIILKMRECENAGGGTTTAIALFNSPFGAGPTVTGGPTPATRGRRKEQGSFLNACWLFLVAKAKVYVSISPAAEWLEFQRRQHCETLGRIITCAPSGFGWCRSYFLPCNTDKLHFVTNKSIKGIELLSIMPS
jgi:hypothetical protein